MTNFSNYVGKYEIWPADRMPAKDRRGSHGDEPALVQTGAAKFRAIKGEALSMAVDLLVQTNLPRPPHILSHRSHIELREDEILFGEAEALRRYESKREKHRNAIAPDYSEFGKTVLKIAAQIGMLRWGGGAEPKTDLGFIRREPIEYWISLADTIQAIFYGREARQRLPNSFIKEFGELEIFLAYTADQVVMRLAPKNAFSAVVYHAAQMISIGTNLRHCDYCHKPFLSGGEARGGGKRRRDARFCKNECRYSFHSAMRRKQKL